MNKTCFVLIFAATPSTEEQKDSKYKDWVFINYTYKRFEGLTQRGPGHLPLSKR
jgi:serine/threonine kinase 38